MMGFSAAGAASFTIGSTGTPTAPCWSCGAGLSTISAYPYVVESVRRQVNRALTRARAQNSREYFRNRCCFLQVPRAYFLGCWHCSGVPVIDNTAALLIGSTVIKFLVVVVIAGGLVISPPLSIL